MSDADKAVRKILDYGFLFKYFSSKGRNHHKNDTERNEELINMKKAWETLVAGRTRKAMKTRQKFLESLQPKPEEPTADGSGKPRTY